jgi:hypothetical protein
MENNYAETIDLSKDKVAQRKWIVRAQRNLLKQRTQNEP